MQALKEHLPSSFEQSSSCSSAHSSDQWKNPPKGLFIIYWAKISFASLSNRFLPSSSSSGVPRIDGHSRPHTLCAEPSAHYRPYPGCLCVPGSGLQRPDLHLHISAHQGAVEPGGGASGCLLHCHSPWLHLSLSGWLLRQWRHCHFCPAVYLLSLG